MPAERLLIRHRAAFNRWGQVDDALGDSKIVSKRSTAGTQADGLLEVRELSSAKFSSVECVRESVMATYK